MQISLYTAVRNGLYYDYHIVEMLKHHLSLADEIIVHDGNSTDGTYEKIIDLDPRIKVFRSDWGRPKDQSWFVNFKEEARRRCSGDWCILLDPDEFIPEWEFDNIRHCLEKTDKHIVRLDWIHFYGNYKVYNANPGKFKWAQYKYQIHRNLKEMEIWGDGSHVRLKNQEYSAVTSLESFTGHHFGAVRKAARLRQKLRTVSQIKKNNVKWIQIPSFIFNLLPYNWFDKDFIDDLRIYKGPYVNAVQKNQREFIRDNLVLYNFLVARDSTASSVSPLVN